MVPMLFFLRACGPRVSIIGALAPFCKENG